MQRIGNTDPTFSTYTIFNNFVVHNLEYFAINFSVHITITRKKVLLQSYQRGVYYISITIFNTLPASTAELAKHKKHFISALKMFLIVEFFYLVSEYLNYQH